MKILFEERVSIIIIKTFLVYSLGKYVFYRLKNYFWIKTGHSLIDFDVNFPISEFTNSLNFWKYFEKDWKKKLKNFDFHLKFEFIDNKYIFNHTFNFYSVYSNRSELDLSDETIRFQNCPFSQNFDEKTAESYRNCYIAEKRIVSKLSNISIPNFDSINLRLEWRFWQNFTSLSYRYKPQKSVTVGSGLFIVLDDSSSPKMVIKLYYNFFRL